MSEAQQPTMDQHHEDKADETEPDVHFEPVVKLEKVEIADSEAMESCLFKMRAKLFRFDKTATEWKERGTGDMKLLMHSQTGKVRVLMRREKTLKICANHYITQEMKLNPNVGSDRSWVWTALADFSEEEVKPEMLAVRFANSELAQRFKAKFEEAQAWNIELANQTKSPNDVAHQPKPDPDAVEVKPEDGSDKVIKQAQAAALPEAAASIAAASTKDVSAVHSSASNVHSSTSNIHSSASNVHTSASNVHASATNVSSTEQAPAEKPATETAAEHVASESTQSAKHSQVLNSGTESQAVKEETLAKQESVHSIKQDESTISEKVAEVHADASVKEESVHVESVKQEESVDAKVDSVTDALAAQSIDAPVTEPTKTEDAPKPESS